MIHCAESINYVLRRKENQENQSEKKLNNVYRTKGIVDICKHTGAKNTQLDILMLDRV